MPIVRYIGSKERKEDNVAGTGAVWYGFGDEVEIADRGKANRLAVFVDVWEIVEPTAEQNTQEDRSPPDAGQQAQQSQQKLANLSLTNPEHHDDDDGQVACAPGSLPPAPGTENVPPVASAAGARQVQAAAKGGSKGARGGRGRNA